jgi:D-sedoheptulose 7-phosphate isomerase
MSRPAQPIIGPQALQKYFLTLSGLLCAAEATTATGERLEIARALDWTMSRALAAHAAGNKLIFFGNGGSAAIASHMAADYSKNGNLRAIDFNDAAMLTCVGYDLGYDRVFAKQIELHGRRGDLVVAISSSGRSPNILSAVACARQAGCLVVTLSGFTPDNPLRRLGDLNLYVDSDRYGLVEVSHLTLCHALLDFICALPAPADVAVGQPA